MADTAVADIAVRRLFAVIGMADFIIEKMIGAEVASREEGADAAADYFAREVLRFEMMRDELDGELVAAIGGKPRRFSALTRALRRMM